MKKFLRFALIAALGATAPVDAATGARVARLTKQVKIIQPHGASHAAAVNEIIPNGAAIETGVASQTELLLANGGLIRLGANTLVRLNNAPRRWDLLRGAILVKIPRGNEGEIVSGSVVASLGGTTSLLEFYPQAYTKLIALDGTARLYLPRIVGESVLVDAGQLLMFQAKAAARSLPNPVDIDLKRMMATSLLIKGFPPLGSESSIAQGMDDQKKQKSNGALADTNLVIFGRGTLVSLVPPTAEASPSPSPKRKTPTTGVEGR